jgi:hypothetical protein
MAGLTSIHWIASARHVATRLFDLPRCIGDASATKAARAVAHAEHPLRHLRAAVLAQATALENVGSDVCERHGRGEAADVVGLLCRARGDAEGHGQERESELVEMHIEGEDFRGRSLSFSQVLLIFSRVVVVVTVVVVVELQLNLVKQGPIMRDVVLPRTLAACILQDIHIFDPNIMRSLPGDSANRDRSNNWICHELEWLQLLRGKQQPVLLDQIIHLKLETTS